MTATAEVSKRTAAKRLATAANNRRLDAAIIRTVGATEAVLLAPTEAVACRRASVALGWWSEDGLREEYHRPETVSAALVGWYKLRGRAA